VCFGKTLAASSPKGEPFNWGNVLWHELGHVFAIQLSKAHVPRWFTEGLSEYETFVRRPEWQREEDMPLYSALAAGRIPEVGKFNRAFTHVQNIGDVTMAYYAASQIVTYVGEQHGMPKLVEMLRLWGQGVRDPDVVKRALGIDVSELDRRFRAWLEPRMARYRRQFVPDLRAPSYEEAVKAAKAAPSEVRKVLELTIAAAGEGKDDEARAALAEAARVAPADPLVRYLQAKVALERKDAAGARRIFETMTRERQDGYAVRMQLVDLAEEAKDAKAMRAHLEAARRFDPTQVEALQALYDLAKKENRKDDMVAALRELSVLDQHERRVYRRLMEALAEAARWEELRVVGARAVFVDVHSATVHRLYGEALGRAKEWPKAVFELESALLCKPSEKEEAAIHLELARVFSAAGQKDRAKASAQEVLRIEPGNAEARGMVGR
jgi:tetratricopeptide (TPR) repeat protein